MPVNSGLRAQLGVAIETTVGTYTAPDHFLELLSETLKFTKNPLVSAGLRAGRRTRHRTTFGTQQTAGGVRVESAAEAQGILWRLAMGAVATTGAGPYTHVFTPGDLPSATFQVGKPGTGGTVHPHSYLGSYVNGWELSVTAGEFVNMSVDLVGSNEVTNESLASATFPSLTPLTFAHATLTMSGGSECFDSLTIAGANNLDVHFPVCATNPGHPRIRESARREYSGTFNGDFSDLDFYDDFRNGTAATLTLALNAGTSAQLTLSGNCKFWGDTPNVAGPEVLKQQVPFVFESITGDSNALTVTLINGDSTP